MNIKFNDKGRISILMKDYIAESVEVLERFGNTIVAAINSPAKKFLFVKMI